ncbi:unnamed protein product [Lactuca virosa]|uniref:RRM domain-containing protein n=1 Tax=Lactuca virosa TaxID=75947 RepID=A0AAU9LQI2_9ASTR|nr:unnamed protein product [Lactuca virosa]
MLKETLFLFVNEISNLVPASNVQQYGWSSAAPFTSKRKRITIEDWRALLESFVNKDQFVSSVTDHVSAQDTGAKAADFDDDDGGGLALNAQSRAMLMAKLDRSGITTGIPGALGAPIVNGSGPTQGMDVAAATIPILPRQFVSEPIGNPNECLLLKNMYDPAAESDPEFDLDIKEDVGEECSNYGRVKHIYVAKESAGYVYLRFESVDAASRAQQVHKRWFARSLISAIFLGQDIHLLKEVTKAISSFNKKPVILALSNPTSQSECTVEQAYKWRALIFFQKRI